MAGIEIKSLDESAAALCARPSPARLDLRNMKPYAGLDACPKTSSQYVISALTDGPWPRGKAPSSSSPSHTAEVVGDEPCVLLEVIAQRSVAVIRL